METLVYLKYDALHHYDALPYIDIWSMSLFFWKHVLDHLFEHEQYINIKFNIKYFLDTIVEVIYFTYHHMILVVATKVQIHNLKKNKRKPVIFLYKKWAFLSESPYSSIISLANIAWVTRVQSHSCGYHKLCIFIPSSATLPYKNMQ